MAGIQYDMKNILDIPLWERMQDQLAEMTGTAIICIDYKGNPMTKHSGRTEFCSVIRENPVSRKRCYRCDALAGLEAVRLERPYIYLCHCGIVDVAVPVMVGDKYLGAVMFGQVRLVNKDREKAVRLVNEISSFQAEEDAARKDLLEKYEKLPEMEYERIVDIVTTIAASCGDHVEYALEGSIFVGGAAVQWLRDELNVVSDAAETQQYAEKVPDTAGAYVVPAFTGLGAPYWNQRARGTVVGITRGFSRAHLVRATLESIVYQTQDIIEAMERDSGIGIAALKVDGGACANNFLMQFQADIAGCSVYRPKCIETTALGAAYLAGLAVGYWESLEDVKQNQGIDRVFTPAMDKEKRAELLRGWHKAVKCAQVWAEE